jgi:hypothetical protein
VASAFDDRPDRRSRLIVSIAIDYEYAAPIDCLLVIYEHVFPLAGAVVRRPQQGESMQRVDTDAVRTTATWDSRIFQSTRDRDDQYIARRGQSCLQEAA